MPTWKLTLEYDGTRYRGWQEQKNARTVAGEVRKAAESLLGGGVGLLGAGRTDAGVHALAQVARLRAERTRQRQPSGIELLYGLNDRLPPDINLLRVEETRWNFDPRREARARYYLYQISQRRTAFAKKYVWWVRDGLDVVAMQAASESLVGRHGFSRFAETRDDERSTIVVVESAQVEAYEELVLFRIGASHFLWKMVRRLVGALVEVGRGQMSAHQFAGLVDGGGRAGNEADSDVAAHTAPPSGLFLELVAFSDGERPHQLRPALFPAGVTGLQP